MKAITTPRDRVKNALLFKESDICPYYIWISQEMNKPLADYYGNADFTDNYIIDHLVMHEIGPVTIPLDNNRFTDEFGTVWKKANIPHVEKPTLPQTSLQNYSFPDMASEVHFEQIPDWLAKYDDRFKVVQLGQMLFDRAWILRGFENLMMDFYDAPGFVVELMDNLENQCSKMIDVLIENWPEQIDAIGFADDYGSQNAIMVDPEIWRRFMKPGLKRLYEQIKDAGKHVYTHTCGNVLPIIPDFIEIGLDMLQPIQPEAMDIYAVKKEFGKELCLVGGISTQATLPFGSPEDVKNEVQECIEHMGKGGGYVMAPAKPILKGVPLENAVALIDSIVLQKPER